MPNFSNKTRTAANLDAMVFRGYLGKKLFCLTFMRAKGRKQTQYTLFKCSLFFVTGFLLYEVDRLSV